ncbi:MAG: c-type cytochrome [Myxococcota bacterium]|nr:c-type cytochrome [Myxococcota bacterium]
MRHRSALWLGTAVWIAMLALPAAGAESDVESGVESEQAGHAEFARYCSSCHGMLADGRGPVADELKTPPPDLTRIAARRDGVFPEAAMLRIIDGRDPVVAHGSREMPIWGEEFRSELPKGPGAEGMARGRALLLVRYLASIQVLAE